MEEEEEGERGKGIGGGEEKDLEGVLLRRTPSGEDSLLLRERRSERRRTTKTRMKNRAGVRWRSRRMIPV